MIKNYFIWNWCSDSLLLGKVHDTSFYYFLVQIFLGHLYLAISLIYWIFCFEVCMSYVISTVFRHECLHFWGCYLGDIWCMVFLLKKLNSPSFTCASSDWTAFLKVTSTFDCDDIFYRNIWIKGFLMVEC